MAVAVVLMVTRGLERIAAVPVRTAPVRARVMHVGHALAAMAILALMVAEMEECMVRPSLVLVLPVVTVVGM